MPDAGGSRRAVHTRHDHVHQHHVRQNLGAAVYRVSSPSLASATTSRSSWLEEDAPRSPLRTMAPVIHDHNPDFFGVVPLVVFIESPIPGPDAISKCLNQV